MLTRILLAGAFVLSADSALAADGGEKAARDAVHSLLPNVAIDQVFKSDLPGFYEVLVGGQVVYVSADGKFLLQGNLYNVPEKRDLTEARVASARMHALEQLPQDKRIRFAPEHPRHTVTVFTDVDCPYCRQFHKQIAQYNQLGIAVDYVFFPLDIHPGADKKAQAVWCAADRRAAYTAAMSGTDPGSLTCANPIAETKALALALNITGTPTIIAEDGTQVQNESALSPNRLADALDRLKAIRAKAGTVAATQ